MKRVRERKGMEGERRRVGEGRGSGKEMGEKGKTWDRAPPPNISPASSSTTPLAYAASARLNAAASDSS